MLRNLAWQRLDFVYDRDAVPAGLGRSAELSFFLKINISLSYCITSRMSFKMLLSKSSKIHLPCSLAPRHPPNWVKHVMDHLSCSAHDHWSTPSISQQGREVRLGGGELIPFESVHGVNRMEVYVFVLLEFEYTLWRKTKILTFFYKWSLPGRKWMQNGILRLNYKILFSFLSRFVRVWLWS